MSEPKRDTWNHRGPVVLTPLYTWPFDAKAAFLALTKRWVTLTRATLFLLPVMVFTILLRKHLLRGITFGAVRK